MAKAKNKKRRKSRRSKGFGFPGMKKVSKQEAVGGLKLLGGGIAGIFLGKAINYGMNKVLKVEDGAAAAEGVGAFDAETLKKFAGPAVQLAAGAAAAIMGKDPFVKGLGAGVAANGGYTAATLLLGDKMPAFLLGEPATASATDTDYSETSAAEREKIANLLLKDDFQPALPAGGGANGVGDLPWITPEVLNNGNETPLVNIR